jgi:hypothetical protein
MIPEVSHALVAGMLRPRIEVLVKVKLLFTQTAVSGDMLKFAFGFVEI